MMRIVWAFLLFRMGFSFGSVPVPETCEEWLANEGVCVISHEPDDHKGSVQTQGFVIVYKDDYPKPQDAVDQFFDFGSWPSYYAAADYDKLDVLTSVEMPESEIDYDGRMVRQRWNYFHVVAKVPVIGKQKARGVVGYTETTTDPTVAVSYLHSLAQSAIAVPEGEKPLPNGHEGLVHQSGILMATECVGLYEGVCDPANELLVVYTPKIRYKIAVLIQYQINTANNQIESLLTGMYLR